MIVQADALLAVTRKRNELSGTMVVLLKWKDLPEYEATWEDIEAINTRFSEFHLENNVLVCGWGNIIHCSRQPEMLKSICETEESRPNGQGKNIQFI